ncbi:MAG: alpha-1,2-fucosyltransferase [Dysgonamonadaceae bacterium]|jgi:hypothetical protein|nr:alpha-1,2-fucosyltransferase [Dysgonamonadaceae bacterium]
MKEIILLNGGLGNQMFQYAFYLAKKKKNMQVFLNNYYLLRVKCHNGYELEKLFGIQPDNSSKMAPVLRKLLIFKNIKPWKTISKTLLRLLHIFGLKYVEYNYTQGRDPLAVRSGWGLVFYGGVWANEIYFSEIEREIREIYTFNRQQLSPHSVTILEKIKTSESVSIHVRRGDFITDGREIYGSEYYEEAVRYAMKNIPDTLTFFVFSDEPDWAEENLKIPCETYFFRNRRTEDAWQDMYLMSKCKHNIITNSTFSWWAAWLNDNNNKVVIAPKQSNDPVIPRKWIKI